MFYVTGELFSSVFTTVHGSAYTGHDDIFKVERV